MGTRDINISYSNSKIIFVEQKAEFLVVGADMALRMCEAKSNTKYIIPNINNYRSLVNADISLTDMKTKKENLIKIFGYGGVPLLAHWQNRFSYKQSNVIARMHLLYEEYNDVFLNNLGFSLKDIYIITFTIYGIYHLRKKIYLKKEDLFHPEIESLSIEKLTAFFKFFSISQKDYIDKAKKAKIYSTTYGKFRFLIRYPIISLENEKYIIPVIEQYFDTISNNLYFILLEHYLEKNEAKKYLDNFGNVLEKYVIKHVSYTFGSKNIKNADDIVTVRKENRCEIVAFHGNKALAIEVKKLYFKRDTIIDKDKEDIDKTLRRHLVKAYQQIENTFNYIKEEYKYGLIVIPDVLLGLKIIVDYLKKQFKDEAHYDKRIIICTLSWFEELFANNPDNIFKILDIAISQSDDFEKGNDICFIIDELDREGTLGITKNNALLMKKEQEILAELERIK